MIGLGPVGSTQLDYAVAASAARAATARRTARTDSGIGSLVAIARPVLHVLAQAVDNHAGDGHVRLLQHCLGALQRHELMHPGTDDQDRGVDHPSQHPAIGHPQDGRTVQDHTVIMVLQGRQQLPEFKSAKNLDRDVTRVARRDEVEIAQLGMAERSLPGKCALKHINQAVGGALFFGLRREDVRQRRTAQIDIKQ